MHLMAFFYAFLLIGNSKRGVKVNFLRKQLGIGMRAAHLLGIKIRTHIAFYDRPSKLGGKGKKVYVDEAFLPCVRDCRNASEKNVIVMGVACDGFVLCGIIPDRTSATLVTCVERFVEPGSVLVTDGLKAYRSLERRGWAHIVVNHSVAFHDFEGNTTNQIEVFWSVLKRNLRAYRQVGRNHLWCYLAETEFAYNRRRAKRNMFDEIVSYFPTITDAALTEVRRRFDWSL